MNLFYPEVGREVCDRSIFITGIGRSGTTILGKLIHSMQRVEYVFEPPTLASLMPLIENLPRERFVLLFESYCVEELLIGQVTGRAFNYNKNDDSYIGLVKTQAEINKRLNESWSKSSAMDVAHTAVLATKLPEMAPYLPTLRQYYPGIRLVITQRAPNPVIQSVVAREWFTDAKLAQTTIIWPSQTRDFCTPAWVAAEDVENWRRWREHDRAAYYYIRMSRSAAEVPDAIIVPYERLVEEPMETVADLAARLKLEFGDLTRDLIAGTKLRSSAPDDWLTRLSPALRKEIQSLSS